MHANQRQSPATAIPLDRILNDRRQTPRVPLMIPAWVWRGKAAQPTAIRLLDHSAQGVGFVCPLPLDPGERIELGLERDGVRRTGLRVAYCEFYGADTFRVGAHV
jgi:hypothetical protein